MLLQVFVGTINTVVVFDGIFDAVAVLVCTIDTFDAVAATITTGNCAGPLIAAAARAVAYSVWIR